MIQRIQTIWLLLASLTAAGILYFDVYRADVITNGATATEHLRVGAHFPSLIVVVVMMLLPLIAIFLYKNRKRQRGIVLGDLLATFGFMGVNQMRISKFNSQIPAPTDGTYFVGSILPVLILLFLVLALKGIRKDEKLVRSLDRLR